ncbi:hypothetical protein IV102_24155 [bacterium]|nr:hypothetical protein [bacterium]
MKIQTAPQPLPPPKRKMDVPEDISLEYIDARESAQEEPPNLKGVVYEQTTTGDITILKHSGQTTGELPADIPESAVKDGRVVIYVDGIHQEMSEQNRQIKYFLHGFATAGADVNQSVIGIHEGAGKSGFRDGVRIAKVLSMLKLVQHGVVPLEWASKKIYTIDPAIKSVHDEVKQSLLAGRKVQLMTHSGGGAETATALTLLAREGMREQIQENVRVLSLASAAAHKDFVKAGVKKESLYYTGSQNDPVHYLFRHYLSPCDIPSAIGFAADVVRYGYHLLTDKTQQTAYHYHSPDYIFAASVDDQGQRIQRFLDGGPGGNFPLP